MVTMVGIQQLGRMHFFFSTYFKPYDLDTLFASLCYQCLFQMSIVSCLSLLAFSDVVRFFTRIHNVVILLETQYAQLLPSSSLRVRAILICACVFEAVYRTASYIGNMYCCCKVQSEHCKLDSTTCCFRSLISHWRICGDLETPQLSHPHLRRPSHIKARFGISKFLMMEEDLRLDNCYGQDILCSLEVLADSAAFSCISL